MCRQGLIQRNSEPQLCTRISVHKRNFLQHRCTRNFIGPIRQRRRMRRTIEKRTPATSQREGCPRFTRGLETVFCLRDKNSSHEVSCVSTGPNPEKLRATAVCENSGSQPEFPWAPLHRKLHQTNSPTAANTPHSWEENACNKLSTFTQDNFPKNIFYQTRTAI